MVRRRFKFMGVVLKFFGLFYKRGKSIKLLKNRGRVEGDI